MENTYQKSYLNDGISFRFNGWLKLRKDNKDYTGIIWLKNKRMMFDDGIYNSKTPILIFLN